MSNKKILLFQQNYPFLTCIQYGENEYLGIIINHDNQITSIYDIDMIHSEAEKEHFLKMGDLWWWESNRKLPINIFLKSEMVIFKKTLRTFNTKDVNIVFGPSVSLNSIMEHRSKRKSFQLVRRV